MEEKTTGDLERGIMEEPSLDTYLKENRNCFFDGQITELLAALYRKRHISKAALARKARCISTRYFPGGVRPPGTVCCACVSPWGLPWRRPSSC